jgi:hypothetical protein
VPVHELRVDLPDHAVLLLIAPVVPELLLPLELVGVPHVLLLQLVDDIAVVYVLGHQRDNPTSLDLIKVATD